MNTFNKVLIAEDYDSINISLIETLQSIAIPLIHHAKYCDDALLKVKRAILDNEPYDLFICDLSFQTDYREVKIKTGDELIEQVKILQPEIKIIAYTIEEKSYRIRHLFEHCNINAYVNKGRNSLIELKTAIQHLQENKTYISPEKQDILFDKTINEIDSYDVKLIQLLSNGFSQEEIETNFKELNIIPNGRSTIEKRINKLKDYFKAKNTIHLIAIAKDLGIA